MHYLGLALYAEGPTDYYFLRPLLLRLCEDICTLDANQPVEVSEEVIALDEPDDFKAASRERRIVEAAKQARGAWRIVFIHTDGEGDPDQCRLERAQPAIDLLHQELAQEGVGVAVIPVRESESWMLADGDALREVFGTTLTDQELGLPRTNAIESLQDPKAILSSAFDATNPPSKRKRQGASPMLPALGETISLQKLRNLPSFNILESELRLALRLLNILH